MAVKKIIGKVLTKYDTESPNFKPIEKKVEEVSGNVTPKNEENVYGEYMKFDILSKVRDTMKFKSLEDLQLQIKTDIKNLLELQYY